MKVETRIFTAVAAVAACGAWFTLAEAQQITKCVGKDGKVSYQQTPCDESQTQSKVTLPGLQWERYFVKRRPDDLEFQFFVDVSRIADQGKYKRIFARQDTVHLGKMLKSEVSEELFDCRRRLSKILAYDGVKRTGEYEAWFDPDGVWDSSGRSASLHAKICIRE